MTTTTSTATPADLRADADRYEAEAAASFDRCDTDGFVSQWAGGLNSQQARLQAEITEADGLASFAALYDVDTDERVPAKLIDGRYGLAWALVVPGTDRFTGEFVKAFPARTSTMARKGYREGTELAPARAKITGSGHGLAGAASCYVTTARTDAGTGQDERVRAISAEEQAALDGE